MTEVGASWGYRGAPLSLLPEGRTYSPPARWAGGGTAALRQARALRGGLRSLRRAPDNAAVPAAAVAIVCAEGAVHLSLSLRKPAPGSFFAEAGHPKSLACFLFCERETEKGNTEVIATGNIPPGSESHQQRHRPIRMRSIGLFELFRHL